MLNLTNAWRWGTAPANIFFRAPVIREIGGFDETLGPGSRTIWGGGEDTDYVLSAVKAGFAVYYHPHLVALHPDPFDYGYQKVAERAYSYGAGFGRFWRKHDFPVWLDAYYLLRPIGGALFSLATGNKDKARYYWKSFRGRLRGWLS